ASGSLRVFGRVSCGDGGGNPLRPLILDPHLSGIHSITRLSLSWSLGSTSTGPSTVAHAAGGGGTTRCGMVLLPSTSTSATGTRAATRSHGRGRGYPWDSDSSRARAR